MLVKWGPPLMVDWALDMDEYSTCTLLSWWEMQPCRICIKTSRSFYKAIFVHDCPLALFGPILVPRTQSFGPWFGHQRWWVWMWWGLHRWWPFSSDCVALSWIALREDKSGSLRNFLVKGHNCKTNIYGLKLSYTLLRNAKLVEGHVLGRLAHWLDTLVKKGGKV